MSNPTLQRRYTVPRLPTSIRAPSPGNASPPSQEVWSACRRGENFFNRGLQRGLTHFRRDGTEQRQPTADDQSWCDQELRLTNRVSYSLHLCVHCFFLLGRALVQAMCHGSADARPRHNTVSERIARISRCGGAVAPHPASGARSRDGDEHFPLDSSFKNSLGVEGDYGSSLVCALCGSCTHAPSLERTYTQPYDQPRCSGGSPTTEWPRSLPPIRHEAGAG